MQTKNAQLHTTACHELARSPVRVNVVAEGLCIGCGTCAGVCPSNCLQMRSNQFGEYNPVETEGCTECGLCAKVCPFGTGNPNETAIAMELYGGVPGIGKRIECGHYLSSFVGYSAVDRQRVNGASGGLATWTLETLLRQGTVDRVICASPNPDPEKLFRYAVVDTPEQLRACAKSCYYPLEMSEVVQYAMANEGRYAVVGLPCFLKAIRLAEMRNPRLRERIVFHAGLVCGKLPGKSFAEYVIKLAGGDLSKVEQISFREKHGSVNACDMIFTYRYRAGSDQPDGSVHWDDGYGQAWNSGCFKNNACNYCDDIFAEVADCVFMDAWLRPYLEDPKGTSFVLARTKQADDLLRFGISHGELALSEASIDRCIMSQAVVVQSKRRSLEVRLHLDRLAGRRSPRKRVWAAADSAPQEIQKQQSALDISKSTRLMWPEVRLESLRMFYRRVPAFQAVRRKEQFDKAVRSIRKSVKRILLGHKTK